MLVRRSIGLTPVSALARFNRCYFTSDDDHDENDRPYLPGRDDFAAPEVSSDEDYEKPSRKHLSFFEGGTGYKRVSMRRAPRRKDPLNVERAEVPWVDQWYRTKQGFERVNLLAQKTNLSADQVQQRISKLLSVAPGLQRFMPLLHPNLFSAILRNLSHSFEIITMMKSELPAIDAGTVVSGFPRVLTWEKQLLYDCMCFLVVHYKGRFGAAEALNKFPMRLKFLRQLIDVLFLDRSQETTPRPVCTAGRLYQFNKHRKKTDMTRNKLVYFEIKPRLRE